MLPLFTYNVFLSYALSVGSHETEITCYYNDRYETVKYFKIPQLPLYVLFQFTVLNALFIYFFLFLLFFNLRLPPMSHLFTIILFYLACIQLVAAFGLFLSQRSYFDTLGQVYSDRQRYYYDFLEMFSAYVRRVRRRT